MIKKALKNLKVNPRGNFLIGDTTQDILTGKRAHLHTILVKTGYGGGDNEYRVSPDYVAKDLNEAACYIISKKK
jgi:phosphoglycolate phosphatase-like HAD superfamily hydrolase